MFQIGMVSPPVLKVTEGMKICTMNQKPRMATAPKGIIPYKEMQTTLKKVGMSRPAGLARIREDKPMNCETVILETTDNYDWLKNFEMSDGSDSDYRPLAVRDQRPSILLPHLS